MARRRRLLSTVVACVAAGTLLQYCSQLGIFRQVLGPLRETKLSGLWAASNGTKRRIVHVINAYAAEDRGDETSPYHPVTFDQWYTIASIQRAMQHPPPDFEIDFICAIFESDRETLRDLPCRKVYLHRSTQSEYPFLRPSKQLAFIQDVIDAAVAGSGLGLDDTTTSDFYLLMTNADIGLTQYFYHYVVDSMEHREALSVNRMTLPPLPDITLATNSSTLLGAVDSALDNFTSHPGYDCFVVSSPVLKRVRFGDMFFGYPPWGSNVNVALRVMAANYTNLPSNVNGTFHVGNDQSKWAHAAKTKAVAEAIQKDRALMKLCPVSPATSSMYIVMNTINCGRWFKSNRTYDDHAVPSFVQPGYESLYLQSYPNVLRYSQPKGRGHPIVGSARLANATTHRLPMGRGRGWNRTSPTRTYARHSSLIIPKRETPKVPTVNSAPGISHRHTTTSGSQRNSSGIVT
jgi:hypothetical protein